MADAGEAFIDDRMGLSEFVGTATARPLVGNVYAPAYVPFPTSQFTPTPVVDEFEAITPSDHLASGPVTNTIWRISVDGPTWAIGIQDEKVGIGSLWWEEMHVVPAKLALGAVVSTQAKTLEIFNADRFASHDWDGFTNNVDIGLSVTNLPSPFPETITKLTGRIVNVVISTDGPPIVDGTLDFDFDIYGFDILVVTTGTRSIIIGLQVPEAPVQELLGFQTSVIVKQTGKEQRSRLRKAPTQEVTYRYRLTDAERRKLHNQFFAWAGRPFAVPIWWEPSSLTTSAAAGQPTVTVDTTAYGDFRVGGLAMVHKLDGTQDILTVLSLPDPQTITFNANLVNAYVAGDQVVPVRNAFSPSVIQGRRYAKTLEDFDGIQFTVESNDIDIASAAAFSTYGGSVLLDDPNLISGTQPHSLVRKVYITETVGGVLKQRTAWLNAKRLSQKGFRTRSRQQLMELRQLVHYLGGRHRAFYLPTFFDDLIPVSPLLSGSSLLSVERVGYTDFIEGKKSVIRVLKTDGTALIRTVIGQVNIDDTEEQLTVDTAWPSDVAVAEIDRIEYVERMRFDSDQLQFTHYNNIGDSILVAPVRELISE